ncbi:MAG TPA: DUF998 domain-containing protein [Anaerolineales bacterium]|nr:DUF998 domain-containing protein [Anaerolineales bacterium]
MTITVKPVHAISERAIRVVLISATLFILLLAILIVIQPEIDPAWRFVSEHAIGRHGWLMSIAFLLMAASGFTTAIALWSQVKVGGRIGISFLLIGALGLTLAGIFPTDPITTPIAAQSTSSQLHSWGAVLGDGVLIGATIITLGLLRNPSWRAARFWLIGVLALAWLVLVWLMMSMPADGNFGPDVPVGWPSRLLLVSYCLWFIVTAWQALRLRRQNM